MPLARVLVVDDDRLSRSSLGRMIEEAGCAVTVAEDGPPALAAAAAGRFDLVLTDVHLPRMPALQLVPALRALPGWADIPILAVTTDPTRRTRIALLSAGVDDFLQKPVDPEDLLLRMRHHLHNGGIRAELHVVTRERDEALATLADRNAELERLTVGLVAALERANALNDDDTGNHIRRVCAYAEALGRELGCPEPFNRQLKQYAGLHDVGKVGIRDAILKKPGKLTPDEFEEMKAHTRIGHDLLAYAGLPPAARNIALCHHERFGGGGYPTGIAGEEIPLEARIVTVVDVFDALVSRRVYKPAFSLDEAWRILHEGAGPQFDPALVRAFRRCDSTIRTVRATWSEQAGAAAWT